MPCTHNGQQFLRLTATLLFHVCKDKSRTLDPPMDYSGSLDLAQPFII